MFEFMVGAVFGLFVAVVVTGQEAREMRAENRALREALRNIRHGRAGIGAAVLHYIDRVLGDEAGA